MTMVGFGVFFRGAANDLGRSTAENTTIRTVATKVGAMMTMLTTSSRYRTLTVPYVLLPSSFHERNFSRQQAHPRQPVSAS